MPAIAILGAGAWGTALAVRLSDRFSIRLWARNAQHAQALNSARENSRYLPAIPIPNSVSIEPDWRIAVDSVELIVLATPIAALPELLPLLAPRCRMQPFIWLAKGFVQTDHAVKLPHRLVTEYWGESHYGVLSGPSFAEEVARNLPTAITLASQSLEFAQTWSTRLRDERLRIYSSDDLIGVELGGAIKNVLAIAAGISDGLGFGYSARAALLTRGLAETGRLLTALGGRRETLMGLSGLGDLLLTATSDLSRNRRVGLALAQGKSLATILHELGHVAEGVGSARAVYNLAQHHQLPMPICHAVYQVLYENVAPLIAVSQLLQREPGLE